MPFIFYDIITRFLHSYIIIMYIDFNINSLSFVITHTHTHTRARARARAYATCNSIYANDA